MNETLHLAPDAPRVPRPDLRPTFAEFFAGAGMARVGLGPGWRCALANDSDAMKAAVYRANWGDADLVCRDVWDLSPSAVPGRLDLAWASFPCQDLSLAGAGRGMGGPQQAGAATRSGAFWGFWRLIRALAAEGRAPRIVALENVLGVLSARGGRDFRALAGALAEEDYRFGALVCDARAFLPQSRPRVFVVAVAPDLAISEGLAAAGPDSLWHPTPVLRARAGLPADVAARWLWWRPSGPDAPVPPLSALVEDDPPDAPWHGPERTERLLSLMTPRNRAKLEDALRESARTGARVVGALYRRTRADGAGCRAQRVEARFDGVAGCLRTPAGGSSRQTLIVVERGRVRTRLVSAREAARLMGLSDDFRLPARATDAYKVAGDGVAAPVVAHLARHLFAPLLGAAAEAR